MLSGCHINSMALPEQYSALSILHSQWPHGFEERFVSFSCSGKVICVPSIIVTYNKYKHKCCQAVVWVSWMLVVVWLWLTGINCTAGGKGTTVRFNEEQPGWREPWSDPWSETDRESVVKLWTRRQQFTTVSICLETPYWYVILPKNFKQ